MCCQRHGPNPSHHNQRECESRHFEHHLHRDRQADRKQPACRPPSLCNPGKEQEITPQRRYGEEITERKKRHADTRDEGGQSGPGGPHLRESPMTVNQQVIKQDAHPVGRQHDHHSGNRVADSLEKLLKCGKKHKRNDRPRQIAVIRACQFCHFGRLAHRAEKIAQHPQDREQDNTDPAVKRQRILKQPGRRPVIAPGVHLPDKRSQPHRQSCSPKEENHEHRPAERYGRKRQCTETPHHRVIEQLHDHLPDLRKHDGNGQRKVLTVLGQPAPQSSQKSHTKKSRHLRREAKDTVFRP